MAKRSVSHVSKGSPQGIDHPSAVAAAEAQDRRVSVHLDDFETLALRVAQAVSTLSILTNASDGPLQNALGLVTDYLGDCAKDLSELHRQVQP